MAGAARTQELQHSNDRLMEEDHPQAGTDNPKQPEAPQPPREEPMPQQPESSWHLLPPDEVIARLGTSADGLSPEEVAARLERYGPNEIRGGEGSSPLLILLHQFKSPLIYVLLVAMFITLITGHIADAIVIAMVLSLNAVVGFTQEYRAENAMQALMGLVAPRATIRRGGERIEVESRELVPGDVVLLESGDLIPADLRIIDESQLRTDDSLLTGESAPVGKSPAALRADGQVPLADRRNMAFMGTSVSSGRGRGIVVATALNTEIGILAGEVRSTERVQTPLQGRMKRFGHRVSIAIVLVSAAAFLVGMWQGIPPVDMFLTAVAIAVAAIPEGLPIVMTVALAVSVRRMARRNAIIRRLPAVETLGSCTVIASDKTGTLTENRMTVQAMASAGSRYTVTGGVLSFEGGFVQQGEPIEVKAGTPLFLTLLSGMLANEADLRRQSRAEGELVAIGDPTEVALLVAAGKAELRREKLLDACPEVELIPFESERRFSASIRRAPRDDTVLTLLDVRPGDEVGFLKGAPERIVEMCDQMLLDDGPVPIDRDQILAQADEMAADGLRVLAMAIATGDHVESVRHAQPSGLVFLGLAGMLDPPRETAMEAIRRCRDAGIRVIMITGDHASTASAIAGRLELVPEERPEVRTGRELEVMTDEELSETLTRISVFARVSPSQKHRIVNMLRDQGQIVAVTGDGVNDAPALKAAHIGAAMGKSGTDVAREASEMVLADDNFATIYAAVEEGRTAFSNIRKATDFLLSTSVGVVIAIFGTFVLVAYGFIPLEDEHIPLILLPAQILWLNVVTNGIQDVALAFEPGEEEQYRRPPRDPREGLLSRNLAERTVLVGLLLAAVALAMFTWELSRGASLAYAQAATLTAMVIFKALHVGACRSETRSVFRKNLFSNPVLFIGTSVSLAIHLGAMYFPPTQFLLTLQPLDRTTWIAILVAAPSVLIVAELHKLLRPPPVHQR